MTGSLLVDMFQECVHSGGINDPTNFISQLQRFIENSSKFEIGFDNKELHEQMSKFQRKSHSLLEKLKSTECSDPKAEANKGVEKTKESPTEGAVNDDESDTEPKAKKMMMKRDFVESLVSEESSYSCTYCAEVGKQKVFEHLKSYQRHVRKDHEDKEKIDAQDYQARNKVICLLPRKSNPTKLCDKQIAKVVIVRHLKDVHGIERNDKRLIFKGFTTFDRQTFSVRWGLPKEVVPLEEYIEVDAIADINDKNPQNDIRNYLLKNDPKDISEPAELKSVSDGTDDDKIQSASGNVQEITVPTQVNNESNESIAMVDDMDTAILVIPKPLIDTTADTSLQLIDHEEIVVNSSFGVLHSSPEISSFGSNSQNTIPSQPEDITDQVVALMDPTEQQGEINSNEAMEPLVQLSGKIAMSIKVYDQTVIGGFIKIKADTVDDDSRENAEDEENVYDDHNYSQDSNGKYQSNPEAQSLRYEKRNNLNAVIELYTVSENSSFIEEFVKWLGNEENSTYRLSVGHLFNYPDSFTNFCTTNNPQFNLSRLINFKNGDDFLSLPSPISWYKKVGGRSGKDFVNRRTEQLKAFLRLKDFVVFKLNEEDFDLTRISLKRDIRDHIKDVEQQIKDMNLFKKLSGMANAQTNRRKAMKELVFGEIDDEAEYVACKKWFQSKECEEVELEMQDIWTKAMELNSIPKREYDRFATCCLFEFSINDKTRPGAYGVLKNADYAKKVPVYLPKDFEGNDYDDLSEGHKVYKKPSVDAKPSQFEVRLYGDEGPLKGGKRHTLVINLRLFDILEKFE